MRQRFHLRVATLSALAALAFSVTASLTNAQVASPDPGETVVLSPFTVDASADKGYRAANTLAGSRLRTNLKDVAAAISVSTREFMQDINASDAHGLLVYTLGTEIGGNGGNFSGAGIDNWWANMDFLAGHPTDMPTRVRGVASADKARDYYITDIDFDTYNTERVDVSRGPNAILYGLGRPGGVINSTTIAPRWDRNRTKVELQYGRFGSSRAVLDRNQILIPEKLALRVATKYGDDRYMQEEAFVRDHRGFAAATFRPFAHTTLRANFEVQDQTSRKPQVRPPYDLYSPWWKLGKPSYNPTTGLLTLHSNATVSPFISGATAAGSSGTDIVDAVIGDGFDGWGGGGEWGGGVGIYYTDPNSSLPGIQGTSVYGTENKNLRARSSGAGGLMPVVMRGLTISNDYLRYIHRNDVGRDFWLNQQMSDSSVFDFYHHMIEGPNKREGLESSAANITLEQTFFDGKAGIELSYDAQHLDSFAYTPYSWATYGFTIDFNETLSNGMVNPNYGRPIMPDIGWDSSKSFDRHAKRASGFYNLDLRDTGPKGGWLGAVLGQHLFNASYTQQEFFREQFGGRPMLTGLDYLASESVNTTDAELYRAYHHHRALFHVSYVGASVLGTTAPTGFQVSGIRAVQNPSSFTSIPVFYYQDPAAAATTPNAWQTRTVSLISNTDTNKKINAGWEGTRDASTVDSTVFVWQGRLLDGLVLPTVGWRKDSYKTYTAGGASFDPASGAMITDSRYGWTKPTLDDSKANLSYGIAAHLPAQWLTGVGGAPQVSAYYNKSDNTVIDSQRVNFMNKALDPETGSTNEYGLGLSLFRDRLSLRLTRYETNILNQNLSIVRDAVAGIGGLAINTNAANDAGANASRPAAVAAWNVWRNSAAGQAELAGFQKVFGNTTNLIATSDLVSKGYELEVTYNPLPNWRISANAATQDAVRSNSAREELAYITQMKALWNGPAGDLLPNNSTSTVRTIANSNLIPPITLAALLDGGSTQELRKLHMNLVTNYTFVSGRLKNVSIGGAVRTLSKITLGYPVIRDATTGQDTRDVSRPFYGPSEAHYDAWIGYQRKLSARIAWNLQLNVKNLGEGTKLIPVATQPDGSIAAWQIGQPMTWTLTNRFEF